MSVKETISSLSKSDQKYLNRAMELARLSGQKHKHGAVIIKGGRVVSFGFNTQRNLPIDDLPSKHYTYHAEHSAIKHAQDTDLKGAKIYVARLSRRNLPALSRPCDGCMARIVASGIKEVIYTTS